MLWNSGMHPAFHKISEYLLTPIFFYHSPDRWNSLPPAAQPPHFPGLANLMTFSFGPNSCPGYRFTITEMKAFLSTILPRFTFALPEGQSIGKRNGLFTRPFVRGKSKMGVQLPLIVKRVDECNPA